MSSKIKRLALATSSALTSIAVLAPAAMASDRITGGEGWYGETTDKIVTNFGLAIIVLLPALLIVLSILQHRKEEREYQHLEAKHNRADLEEWQGGW
jgi:hypothetical protein